jgi:hypothetical protein
MSLGDALIMQCIKRGGSKMYVSISLIVSGSAFTMFCVAKAHCTIFYHFVSAKQEDKSNFLPFRAKAISCYDLGLGTHGEQEYHRQWS